MPLLWLDSTNVRPSLKIILRNILLYTIRSSNLGS